MPRTLTRSVAALLVLSITVSMGAVPIAASSSAPAATGSGVALASVGQADTANVTFDDQTTNGTVVVVDRIVVPEGGHVTIHAINESAAEQDTPLTHEFLGEALGSSSFLEPGVVHENVRVTLNESVSDDQTLIAVAYQSGSTADIRENDTPYTSEIGDLVADRAVVTVGATEETDTQTDEATEDDEAQTGGAAAEDETQDEETGITFNAPTEISRSEAFSVQATVDGEGVGPSHVQLLIVTDHELVDLVVYGQSVTTFGQGYTFTDGTTVTFEVDNVDLEPGEYTLVIESGGMTATQNLTVTESG